MSNPGTLALAIGGVALFGGTGSILRLLLSSWVGKIPLGILAGNTVASAVVGFLYPLSASQNGIWGVWSLLLATGFAGGLSTFSSWAAQTAQLMGSGNRKLALLNFGLNMFLPVIAALGGMILALLLLK